MHLLGTSSSKCRLIGKKSKIGSPLFLLMDYLQQVSSIPSKVVPEG
jgi:hypothetical protein